MHRTKMNPVFGGFPLSIFLTLILFFYSFSGCYGGLCIDELIRQMDDEALIKSGLNKLNSEEKEYLNLWLQYQAPQYYISTPRVKNAENLQCYFKTEKKFSDCLSSAPHWELALTAVFQNEAPFLREFIEFHKLMGVQHFILYNNLSNDNYIEILHPYILKGEVELIEWPVAHFVYGQCSCYTDAVRRCKGKADWLIIADTDLFYFPTKSPDLISLLKHFDHPNIGGITANILNFGTSNVDNLKKGDLLIELCTKRAALIDKHVRCIVRPERVQSVDNPHFATYISPYFAVDENFSRNEGPFNEKKPVKKIRVNHYAFRTLNFLTHIYGLRHARFEAEHARKNLPFFPSADITQALLDKDAGYCQREDITIWKFLPALRKQIP